MCSRAISITLLLCLAKGQSRQFFAIQEKPIHLISVCGNEADIIEDWLKYHGYVFGFENITVVDNYSTDGSFEILSHYNKTQKLNVLREPNFWQKGKRISDLVKSLAPGTVAIPLDIDEVIVLAVKNGKQKNTLISGMREIKEYIYNTVNDTSVIYKIPAIWSQNKKYYVKRPLLSITNFTQEIDAGSNTKSFFLSDNFIAIDEGNHGANGPRTIQGFSR